jgi:hypothetical protein
MQVRLLKGLSIVFFTFLIAMTLNFTLPQSSQAYNLKEVELPTPTRCTGLTQDFEPQQAKLRTLYKSDFPQFQKRLADAVMENNNIGGSTIHFRSGDKNVYRSSILARSLPCLAQLVEEKEVGTIVNLYTGDLIDEDELALEEQNEFARMGGKAYLHALNLSDQPTAPLTATFSGESSEPPDPDRGRSIASIQARIAKIVQAIAVADGHVLIHCVGGIHRTGVVYGVLQKCVNKVPFEQIVADYKTHAGWGLGEASQKLYRPIDVELIRSFACQSANRNL